MTFLGSVVLNHFDRILSESSSTWNFKDLVVLNIGHDISFVYTEEGVEVESTCSDINYCSVGLSLPSMVSKSKINGSQPGGCKEAV